VPRVETFWEVGEDIGGEARWFLFEDLPDHMKDVVGGDQSGTGPDLIEHRAERVKIGLWCDRKLWSELFGGHVGDGPSLFVAVADRCGEATVSDLCEAKVHDLDFVCGQWLEDGFIVEPGFALLWRVIFGGGADEEDVVGLEISVNDAAFVCVMKGGEDVFGEGEAFMWWEGTAFEAVAEGFAFEQLHNDSEAVVFFDHLVKFHDVWVFERGEGFAFSLEAAACAWVAFSKGGEHFEREVGLCFDVEGLVDFSHTAFTESLFEDVAGHLFGRGGGRFCGDVALWGRCFGRDSTESSHQTTTVSTKTTF